MKLIGRILVLPFANQTADASLDPLGRIIADRITDGLARIDSVDVVDSRATIAAEQIGSGSAGIDADPTRLAAELGAALVLTGAYRLEGDSLVISARVANVPDGRVVVALSEISALASDPMVGVEELRARGMGAIASLASRRTGEPTGPQLAAPRYPAYLEYVAGLDRLSWWRRGLDALPYFLRAAALDSGFAAPVFWAAYLVERCVRSGLPSFGETRCSAGQRDSLLTALEGMKSGLGPVEREGLTYLRAMAAGDDDGGFAAASRAWSSATPAISRPTRPRRCGRS